MKCVLMHGSYSTKDGKWFKSLERELKQRNFEVILEQFPVDDWDKLTEAGKDAPYEYKQSLSTWMAKFEKDILPRLNGEKFIFIGHSLASVFLLHAIEKFGLEVECGIFVSPFLKIDYSDDFWQFHAVNNTFYKEDFNFELLRSKIAVSYVLYGDDDPYIPQERFHEFSFRLNSSEIPFVGGKHLGSVFGEFPLVVELCETRRDPDKES